jgi:prevent-host-death family protein
MTREVGSYEAKTHLPRLLDEVASGQTITITKRGVPVAVLGPPTARSSIGTAEAIAGLRAFRASHSLAGVTIRELIDEGRS